jgi:hypothetical protein
MRRDPKLIVLPLDFNVINALVVVIMAFYNYKKKKKNLFYMVMGRWLIAMISTFVG